MLLFVALPSGAMAQGDPLYLMEAGGTLGLVTYLGDFNAGIFRGAQPMGGLVLRRVINPYMHLRLAAFAGKIKGSSQGNG
ncbi:MAG: porin family protein, partial [Prevotella conceptionensis]